jgi:hypothetical protein
MAYLVEITEPSLSRARQAELSAVLVRELNVEPEEAELTALVMPALIGPFATAADRDAFLLALAETGFAAQPVADETPVAPPALSTALPDPPAPPVVPPPPAYVPPAYAPPPDAVPASGSNRLVVGVAIALGVLAAVLAVVVWTGRGDGAETAADSGDPPGRYSEGEPLEEATTIEDAPERDAPVRTDDADFALGYSPGRGVNWDLFSSRTQTRYSGAPNGTPIPVRDAPSARHGRAVDDVPPGEPVTTDGCLRPRPEDGGRWCRTDYAGGEGWIYDRYLLASARRAAPSGGLRVVSLRGGQTSLTLSEGGRTWRLPRSLSAGTAVSNVQRTTLAGRDIVQFEARDGRWTTTYFWEYRQGLLHFVGQDGSGTTNVSEAPGSQAVVSAALGYVPGDDVVRGSGDASRPTARPSARPSAPRGESNAPNIIVMGSYQPYDQAGLDARYAQAQRTGLTLQVVASETYGMTPGLRVIVAGPFDRDTALRLLPQVRQVVPDAFRNALD